MIASVRPQTDAAASGSHLSGGRTRGGTNETTATPVLRDYRSYSDDTYRKYDLLQDAINDFNNAMGVGKIRLAGDPAHVIREWDKLGVAVCDFFDHLTDNYDYTVTPDPAVSS